MHPAEFSIFLHRALEARLTRLFELASVEGWQQNPDGLHDVRVASRRVRAVMDLVDSDIYPGFKRHRRRLKALTAALGSVRELDVRLALLDSLKTKDLESIHQAVLEHAQEIMDKGLQRTRRRMEKTLKDLAIPDCAGLLSVPSLPDPFTPGTIADSAKDCLVPRASLALDPLQGLVLQEDPLALHAARVRIKQLRYTVEILTPALGCDSTMALQSLKQLQTVLGDHHDLAELETFLWDLHSQLTMRRRAVLATELLDILGLVAENRRAQFHHFCELAPKISRTTLIGSLDPGISISKDAL